MTVSEVLMNEDSGGSGEGEGPHLHSSHLQQDCDHPIGGLFSPLYSSSSFHQQGAGEPPVEVMGAAVDHRQLSGHQLDMRENRLDLSLGFPDAVTLTMHPTLLSLRYPPDLCLSILFTYLFNDYGPNTNYMSSSVVSL